MDEGIKAEGIRFVLDEEGCDDQGNRIILTQKLIAYLHAARKSALDSMGNK